MVRSGLCFDKGCASGIGFWGANGHDGIWHLSLINSLARGSITMPVFGDAPLKNYHFGFDLIVSFVHRLTGLSVKLLYFQVFPVFLSISLGFVVYFLVMAWQKSYIKSLFAVFFVYFGGSWSYLFGKGESAFWSQQSVSTLINPPFALSLIFICIGLFFLLIFERKNKITYLFVSMLSFGFLSLIKVYAFILSLVSLFFVSLWYLLLKRRFSLIFVFFGSLLLFLFVYSYFLGKPASNMIIWQPFWFLESMFAAKDRFYWEKGAQAMLFYKDNDILIKFIIIYSFSFLVFLLGNIGTRLLAFFDLLNSLRDKNNFDFLRFFGWIVVFAGIIIPTFFIQKGTAWNTIQFFYYSLFFLAIFTGVFAGYFIESKKYSRSIKIFFASFLILLTIPTTFISLKDIYLTKFPPTRLPKEEFDALDFLSKEPFGLVLTYPYGLSVSDYDYGLVKPLYLYDSTAYVSAFSGKPTFLEDENNLEITQYDWKERKEGIKDFFSQRDVSVAKGFLVDNNIRYIYLVDNQHLLLDPASLGLREIFKNSKVVIYQTN
jgi:hypothetical protein